MLQLVLLLAHAIPDVSSSKSEDTKDFYFIGCSPGHSGYQLMADSVSISALRMSEVLELALYRRAFSSSRSQHSSASSSSGSIFSWMKPQPGSAVQSSAATLSSPEAKLEAEDHVERWVRYSHFLLPMKIRFAFILADMGLIREAQHYISAAISFVKDITGAAYRLLSRPFAKLQLIHLHDGIVGLYVGETTKQNSTTKKVFAKANLSFSKKLLKALGDFEERLSISTNSSTCSSSLNSAFQSVCSLNCVSFLTHNSSFSARRSRQHQD